jgi:hypothetical protein
VKPQIWEIPKDARDSTAMSKICLHGVLLDSQDGTTFDVLLLLTCWLERLDLMV